MKIGLALRSTVFSPSSISRMIPILDKSGVDSVWFPSVGRAFDAIDMSGISLGASSKLRAGTGVIRCNDYDSAELFARVNTLSGGSEGRFILGVGTGSETGGPAIDRLVALAQEIRSEYPDNRRLPIFFAALRRRILRVALANVEGAILNFCPPAYVQSIMPQDVRREGFTLACYIKLFFAQDDAVARRMLIDEMKTYNSLPQYRMMFEEIGVSGAIGRLDAASGIPEELLAISCANPSNDQILRILDDFRRVGVDLPIVYPYISGDDAYKMAVVEHLSSLNQR